MPRINEDTKFVFWIFIGLIYLILMMILPNFMYETAIRHLIWVDWIFIMIFFVIISIDIICLQKIIFDIEEFQ
jgi:hypothetical protein